LGAKPLIPRQAMSPLKYLGGYPPALLQQVQQLIDEGRLAATLARRYPDAHDVRSDRALVDYVQALKARHLRSAPPLHRVAFDNRMQVVQHALGTHTRVSRVQGNQLKAKREIRVASVFREAPAAFLRMIVVHELAHLKEPAHDKAFYALCTHMEGDYHQLEFDTRLWLTAQELPGLPGGADQPGLPGRADQPGLP
jgi:predicted metal-dependent hydrolase